MQKDRLIYLDNLTAPILTASGDLNVSKVNLILRFNLFRSIINKPVNPNVLKFQFPHPQLS